VELLSDLLVSMGGLYNVHRESVPIVLKLDDGVSPAEVVRRVLDLGHGLARLMESPYVVTAAYYPQAAAFW
jgi:hypothetical protein